MHYGIITYGSRGDVQPYIALALALTNQGHAVGFLGNENFSKFVADYGIDFYPLPGNTETMLRSPQMAGILKSGNIIAYLKELRKLTQREQSGILEKMLAYCKDFDVLIATPLTMVWAFSIAERLKKPWAIIQLTVPAIPTAEFPFLGLNFFNAKKYNKFTYRLMRWFFWNENKKDVQTQRDLLGLQPLKKSLLKIIDEQQILHLYAFSRFLIKRPSDWPPQVDITGFLNMSAIKKNVKEEDFNKKVEISNWLQQDKPPIYIGFGSIPIPDPQFFFNILYYLLNNTDERYIFCQGWSHNIALPKNNRLFEVQAINHDWLFPQCKQAIIHGGIGTIGAVLRAKIPMIVISIFGDQPIWGRFIAKNRIGAHIPFKKLTEQKILSAIKKTDQETIKSTVRDIGTMMEQEDGVIQAVSKLEAYFKYEPV